MSVQAIVNASISLSGSVAGPEQIVIPPIVASSALDIRATVQMSAGFTTLTSLFGATTLTGATGMWIIPNGATASVMNFAVGAATQSPICTAPNPALVTAGITLANIGLCLSVATTCTFILF